MVYANGDHGIDVHNAVDARIIANTVSGNYDSGIEMTTSTGSLLANNISVDNGMNSVRTSGNIRANAASVTGGSTVNDDLVSLATPGVMIDWAGVKYSSLAAFRTATGQESRGVEGVPRFANAAAGDFHLLAGSPAIDAANTAIATEPTVDFDGSGARRRPGHRRPRHRPGHLRRPRGLRIPSVTVRTPSEDTGVIVATPLRASARISRGYVGDRAANPLEPFAPVPLSARLATGWRSTSSAGCARPRR